MSGRYDDCTAIYFRLLTQRSCYLAVASLSRASVLVRRVRGAISRLRSVCTSDPLPLWGVIPQQFSKRLLPDYP